MEQYLHDRIYRYTNKLEYYLDQKAIAKTGEERYWYESKILIYQEVLTDLTTMLKLIEEGK